MDSGASLPVEKKKKHNNDDNKNAAAANAKNTKPLPNIRIWVEERTFRFNLIMVAKKNPRAADAKERQTAFATFCATYVAKSLRGGKDRMVGRGSLEANYPKLFDALCADAELDAGTCMAEYFVVKAVIRRDEPKLWDEPRELWNMHIQRVVPFFEKSVSREWTLSDSIEPIHTDTLLVLFWD